MSESLSTMEYENLEQKYVEVKTKLKKTLQGNEKYSIQIQKLSKDIKRLESENNQLKNQIHSIQNTIHESESDASSSDRHNQKETNMANLVHSKNLQITALLKDIEDVERENTLLREKLAETKDELSTATSEISSTTSILKAKQIALEEQYDLNKKMSSEIENLQEEIELCKNEKNQIEKNLEIFSSQVNKKVDEWKNLLDKKNSDIAQLENENSKRILKYSSSNSEDQDEVNDTYLSILKRDLSDAEIQLSELKFEMEKYTQDLKESADAVNKLKLDRTKCEKKIKEMEENERKLKFQNNKLHDRCQNLQKEVEFANKLTTVFETDLSKLKGQLKENGQIDMVKSLEDNQSLKIQNLFYEKQITGLIKDINQLQEVCNTFERENAFLRYELGTAADANIIMDPKFLAEGKKQQRFIEKLNLDIQNGNEEKIQRKMEIKNLNRKIASLTNEILQLKSNPDMETIKDSIKTVDTVREERCDDIKTLSEENEALRIGLHEILKSVQEKNETSPREIKSDILEKLLKTLDVKHISGWYHPAMRLQAEIHTLEGVNSELREQLQAVRTELEDLKLNRQEDHYKSTKKDSEGTEDIKMEDYENRDAVSKALFSHKFRNLQDLKLNILKIITYLNESDKNIEEALEQEFKLIQKHIELIHEPCNREKSELLERLRSGKNVKNEMIKETELGHENTNKIYIIQDINKQKEEISKLKDHIIHLEQNHSLQTETLIKKIISFQSKLRIKENNISSISMQQFKQVQDSLNDHIIKYRKLLTNVEEKNNYGWIETETLKQTGEDLTKENTELKEKLKQLLVNVCQERYKDDRDCSLLSEKLAEAELEALSEKQRADHTNNLYKLVKEQLRKSEENFTEFSKYGENLLQKNLCLQERVVDLEDKISFYVDLDLYKELEEKLNSLLKEKEHLIAENLSVRKMDMEKPLGQLSKWNYEKEQELLDLKHEIVDLTSTSEEKLLIGQLHSDLAKCRSEEREMKLKTDFLKNEISLWERRYEELISTTDDERKHFENIHSVAQKKISVLQNLIIKQRIQYYGYVPLIGQEIYAEKIKNLNKEKHEIFLTLQNLKKMENKLQISQESENFFFKNNNDPESEQESEWPYQFKRQYKFKDQQIKYLVERIEAQEKQLEKLEQELLIAYNTTDFDIRSNNKKITVKKPVLIRQIVSQESLDPKKKETQIKILRNVESQTAPNNDNQMESELNLLKVQIKNFESQISAKSHHILETNNLLAQKEREIVKMKSQLEEKNKRVAFLDHKLIELKDNIDKKQERSDNGAAGDGFSLKTSFLDEQIMSLRATLKSVQDKLSQKETEIMKYQTLLKEDRDKHSLAAASLHHELTVLKKSLVLEQEKNNRFEETTAISRQKSAIVEKYVSQVRALEKHLAELHTRQTKLEFQLHASQQEATRWRQMAQERLTAMQELGKSLNDQHKKELTSYKTDYEKLKELSEEDLPKQKTVTGESSSKLAGYVDPEILKLCREKDEKIKELYIKLKKVEIPEKTETVSSVVDNEKMCLTRENEALRKRYEALVLKEKNYRDEIRDLKDQLSKRTTLSARSKQSGKSIKEQLQRKINQLEKEIDVLNDKLSQQILMNENHKLSANENFEKWKKQKLWQENCEKYKNKLQEREDELQKLQHACTGFRMLIERLEREKINLENRIKTLKYNPRSAVADQEIELLKSKNTRLSCELEALEAKMEIRQQGAGALGAALMQEKLEAQERKIAVLELSAKGSVEVRNELERLQMSLSNIQKSNLCLEAENLELKMDLEKYSKETPHLQEQIHHLENYIELLKNENQANGRLMENTEDKKVSQLERTVFILKRVVEKLQVENKRLHNGKRSLSERSSSADKLKRDYLRLKDQYTENLQKIKDLEFKLASSNKKLQLFGKNQPENEKVEHLLSQLEQVNQQPTHKSLLLDKVKALLHGAAAREKQLLKEITELRHQSSIEKDFDTGCSIEIPSPIEEVSEENSDV